MGDGALVQQFGCNGGVNQHWIVADGGNDTVRFVARHSGKVLEVTGGVTADGTAGQPGGLEIGAQSAVQAQGNPVPMVAGTGGKTGSDGAGGAEGHKKSKKPKPADDRRRAVARQRTNFGSRGVSRTGPFHYCVIGAGIPAVPMT